MADETAPEITPAQTQTAESTPAPVESKQTSSQLLEVARREAEVRKAEAARKNELSKLQQELQSYKEKTKFLDEAKNLYKSDPFKVLEQLGMTYEDLTEAVIEAGAAKKRGAPLSKKGGDKTEAVKEVSVKEEVERLLQERELVQMQQQMENAATAFVEEISSFVKENSSKYPHLSELYETIGGAESPEQLIYSAIDEHYTSTGEILDFNRVAEAIEAELGAEWSTLQNKLQPKEQKKENIEKKETHGDLFSEDANKIGKPIMGHGQGTLSANDFVSNDKNPYTLTNKIPSRKPYDAKTEVRKSAEQRALEVLERYEKQKVVAK